MNITFEKDFQGFHKTHQAEVDLSIVNKSAILCKCTQAVTNPGIYRRFNLRSDGAYKLKILAQANNNRTKVDVIDELTNKSILNSDVFLTKDKQYHEARFYLSTNKIRLTIEIGGDSIATPEDYFVLYGVNLNGSKKNNDNLEVVNTNNTENSSNANQNTNNTSNNTANNTNQQERSFKITRTFETVDEMNSELQSPLRSNQTPMEIGEYAILKNTTSPGEDLYVLSLRGLQYVSKIGTGLPGFFGTGLINLPGRVVPVYENREQAQSDLNSKPRDFYLPKTNYEFFSNQIKGEIYLYLDPSGYVRWLNYQPTN